MPYSAIFNNSIGIAHYAHAQRAYITWTNYMYLHVYWFAVLSARTGRVTDE